MWFYKFDVNRKDNTTKITWNTSVTYFKNILGFGGVLACFLNYVLLAVISLSGLAILLGYYLYKYGDLVRILRYKEKEKQLKYTGSRYSFKNPLEVYVTGDRKLYES